MSVSLEIERKFLICCPEQKELRQRCQRIWEIRQTYLKAEDPAVTLRLRMRSQNEICQYFRTEKRRVSDCSCQEKEELISRETYFQLLASVPTLGRTICKTRYCLPWEEHVFEIDIYDFWKNTATMEVELAREEEAFSFPPGIRILAEVTGDRRFSNASLAREIPDVSEYLTEKR